METNAMYKETWNKIQEDITRKIRELLCDIRDKVGQLAPREIESCTRLCDMVLKTLPEPMKGDLEEEIKGYKEDIGHKMKDAEDAVNEKLIQTHLVKTCQEIVTTIEKKWMEEDTQGALSMLKELFRYKVLFKENIQEFNHFFSTARNTLVSNLNKCHNDIITSIDSIFCDSVDVNGTKWMAKLLDFMLQCIELKKDVSEMKENKDKEELLPDNFNDKIKELNAKLISFFCFVMFQDMNCKDLLVVCQQESAFFQKVKTFMKRKAYCNISEEMKLLTYSEIKHDFNSQLQKLLESIVDEGIINNNTTINDTERDRFFKHLKAKLEFVKQISQWNSHVTNVETLKKCPDKLEKEIQNLVTKINLTWTAAECDYINLSYSCLSFMQKYSIFENVVKLQIEAVDVLVRNRVTQLENEAIHNLTIESIIPSLLAMKQMSVHIFRFKDVINNRIDELVNAYKRKYKDIPMLALSLEKDSTGMGEMIVAEHNVFKGYTVALFNQKTQSHGIDYVLQHIEVKKGKIDKIKLAKRYEEFLNMYRKVIKDNLQKDRNVTDSCKQCKNACFCVGCKNSRQNPDYNGTNFCLWTLQNSQYYHDANGTRDQDNYLTQPHAAQVIAIFRMLGVDAGKPELISNLVQIGTGEGKSVTLAITCCVLALLGFDVNCASYSEYLSTRDFKSFESLFNILGVIDYIHYGTFNKLCERIINEGGDVRTLVENLILPDKAKSSSAISRVIRAKILLIDEVDVFFNKEFYGSCYSPAATIRHDSITKLINFIWNNRSAGLKLRTVQTSNEYKECCNVLKEWNSLLDEAIKDMLNDIQKFDSGYQVSNDKIGYKEQDSICYDVRYGYKTLFAYYHEHAQNKISAESLKNNICLSFRVGTFSYAEVPKNFSCIMGVSGTLKTLSEPEQKVVESDYGVSKYTYMPSLFGKNNLSFAEQQDILVVDESDYFIVLKKEIDDRLVGKNQGTKRAVLIFFETKQQLTAFYESSNFLPIKNYAIIMTEDNSFQEKESLIKRATTSGQIGLFTKEFGRGTDFVCRDQIVSANGGPHVIQTFLSEELSEEIQIKGRTARQGGSGSYSLVLCAKSLEKFLITTKDIDSARNSRNFYPVLNEKRNKYFKVQYEENKKFVELALKEHKLGQHLVAMLKDKNTYEVKKILCERNRGAEEKKSSRTVVLMDATGSMSHLLQKAKNTVSTMFERIAIILKENALSPDSFEMKFVVYRNYNAPEDMILQVSPWESKPENLRSFMESVVADYGWGNEAIEIGLAHVNRECETEGVSQVILIGDAPANTKEEVITKRRDCPFRPVGSAIRQIVGFYDSGEDYWKNTKFSKPTYYKEELLLLKQRGIRVHAFFVNAQARQNFTEIATATDGRCEALDINSVKGSHLLTNLVSEEVLRDTGGSKGNALVDAYRARFSKTHT
ncbi:Helicase conserved domain containing protein [Reticulomyxa filosa]|uniref:Helicase conserved domain containing protein n=1 Tax=Reticulomyxa filosa TaxID=46433 RepID=X6M475_RETFI|nr:Helicase conserved domain containing protein [Reticulomyxa filosa]|eukprot:ETO08396.1 Helicase conserved domain containing protein [Reticulomyxa filosa]